MGLVAGIHRRIAALGAIAALALAGAVTSAASSEGSAQSSAAVTVAMGDNFFNPTSKRVKPGSTVTWTNNGQNPHTATADRFDTGRITAGQSSDPVTFKKLGKFPYVCEIHPNMRGTIKVCKKIDGVLVCKKPAG